MNFERAVARVALHVDDEIRHDVEVLALGDIGGGFGEDLFHLGLDLLRSLAGALRAFPLAVRGEQCGVGREVAGVERAAYSSSTRMMAFSSSMRAGGSRGAWRGCLSWQQVREGSSPDTASNAMTNMALDITAPRLSR